MSFSLWDPLGFPDVLEESLESHCVDALLLELTEGPLLVLASYMDAHDLCQIDASCNEFRALTKTLGMWRALGVRVYHGIELERFGTLEELCKLQPCERVGSFIPDWTLNLKCGFWDNGYWKSQYGRFAREILEFRKPYSGTEITQVENCDEVIYCRCKLRTDIQKEHIKTASTVGASCRQSSALEAPCTSVYLEVVVTTNADNLSLVLVDFDNGERSSVTFSPDTGAVIKETKTQEEPHRVQGFYIQPLRSKNLRFVGQMGLYIHNGHIAFFRKYTKQEGDDTEPDWETTGFIIDVCWAEGRKLTPCLAFRDEGSYQVHIGKIGSSPPIRPKTLPGAYEQQNWIPLSFEAM